MTYAIYKQYLFFILLIYINRCLSSISSNHYTFLSGLSYSRCDNDQSYQILYGQEIFKNTDQSIPTINSITLSGWFFLRGYNKFVYDLFTVSSVTNVLYKIGYQINTSQIISSTLLASIIDHPFPSIQNNNWYFIYSTITYTPNQVTLTTNIETFSGTVFTSSPQNQPYPGPFQKKDIVLNIGNFISDYSVRQSCSFSRNIKIYWDDPYTNPRSYYNDFLSFNSVLQQNFDFFYYSSNNGFIQNIEQPMNQLQIGINSSGQFEILPFKFFLTDFINISEQSGFAVSFHFKINNPAFSSNIRIVTIKYMTSSIAVELFSTGKIGLNSNFVTGVLFNQWIQVSLIAKINSQLEIYLIVKGYETQSQKITQPINPLLQLPQLQFGSILNQDSFKLNNLRIYKGSFVTRNNNNNCFLQASKNSCILCNSGELIDYQNNQCVSPSSTNISTLITDVKDWTPTRKDCPSNMILDPVELLCKCRFQYYLQNDQCFKCPNYCRGCYDLQSCIKQDPLRLENGQCPVDTFDDGYSCLKNKLQIGSLRNYQLYNPTLYNLGAACSLTINPAPYKVFNDNLRMNGKSNFFFSFTYKSALPAYQRGSIWYLSDGSTELFTVMYNRTSSAIVEFFVQGVNRHFFLVNDNEPVWIGIWSNLQKAVFMVHTNAQLLYKEFNVDISFSFTNPQVCTGPCLSAYDDNYCCGNFGTLPLMYTYIMQNPIDDIMEIQNLIFQQTLQLAQFSVDMDDSRNRGQFIDTQSGLILDFQSNPFTADKVKGFRITQTSSAIISGINISSLLPAFSTYISIDNIQYQTSLVQYSPRSGMSIEYFLVPYSTRVQIRICIQYTIIDCKDSKYSMLNMKEDNYLMIIPRLRSIFSTDITYFEFEIVSNFQRENLKFLLPYQAFSSTPIDINIAKQAVPAGSFSISINNLSIQQGNGSYYFDYTTDQKCFIFKDVTEMSCLVAKQGFVIYKGIAITEEECKGYSKIYNKLFIINQTTKQCEELNLISSCQQPDLTTNPTSCKKCVYTNALQDTCECPDGTYADQEQLKCIPCNKKCLTCKGDSDTCIICKSVNQLPPSCDCIETNMFINQNGLCQYCSSRCSTCDSDPNNCIKCAEKRLSPPQCGCDLLFYQEKNDTCLDIICNKICSSCQTNSDNCTICKSGRLNPPNCDCDLNHYPLPDGTCTSCPQSYFYDKITNSCLQCEKPCLQCAGTKDQCIGCAEGLILNNSNCQCQSQGLTAGYINGAYLCLQDMDVQLQVVFKQSYYQLVFIFDYNLMEIDFSNPKRLSLLIQISLSEIPSKEYELIDPYIRENRLYTRLHVKSNFQCRFGQVRFLVNAQFMSLSQTYVLSAKYKEQPIQFELGPYLFTDEILDQKEVGVLINSMKNEHQQILNTVQSTQFIFYLLNTAQPTLLFLLLKINFPPNLYTFYQVFGIMVFPDVVDYQTSNYIDSFKIVTTKLEDKDVTLSSQFMYKRLGLSNSFLVNAPIVIIKYLIMVILILFLKMIIFYIDFSQVTKDKLTNLKCGIIQRINSENETNLLLLSLSILVQFANTNQDKWAVRYGYYFSIAFLVMFAISFYYNLKELNNKNKNAKLFYSTIFTERLKQGGSFFARNYFLFQMIKKYCSIFTLFIFRELPYYACVINATIFFVSCLQTLILKPYKLFLSRLIKIMGDFILSICWIIHFFILKIESALYKQTLFDEEKIKLYLNTGYLVILILLVFNIIFLIEYIQTIYIIIKGVFSKKQSQIQQNNQPANKSHNNYPLDISYSNMDVKDKKQLDKYIHSFLPEQNRKKYAKHL